MQDALSWCELVLMAFCLGFSVGMVWLTSRGLRKAFKRWVKRHGYGAFVYSVLWLIALALVAALLIGGLALSGCSQAPERFTVTELPNGPKWEHCTSVTQYESDLVYFETAEGVKVSLSGAYRIETEKGGENQ